MKKVNRDGKVAVLISPGFGAGWSTWGYSQPQCLFDPKVVQWVEEGKSTPIEDVIDYDGDFYTGGADDLEIVWLEEGTQFRVEEYDGYESLVTNEDGYWMIA